MLGINPLSTQPLSALGGSTYTLSPDLGTYDQTGNNVGLAKGWKLATTLGTYAQTGNAVTFTYFGLTTYKLNPDVGTYSQTGNNASLVKGWHLPTTLGTYAQTGNSIILHKGYTISTTLGTYSQTGNNVAFSYSGATYKLQTALGTYAQTGNALTFQLAHNLHTTLGTYAQTGNPLFPFYNQSEQFTLNFLIELIPAESSTNQQYDRRLIVDGTPISVREWSFREEKDALTGRLDVSLADVSQRSLITRDSEITFEYGTVVNGVTTWSDALVDTGQLERTDYQISRQGLTPNDSFTLTTKPQLLVKLEKTPQNGYILYDPLKHEVTPSDWPVIADTKGNGYVATFVPVYFLTLHQIMTFVSVNVCGFAGMDTNIPDWYVGIVEFKAGELVMNTLGGLLGSFKPDVTTVTNYAGDDVLYFRDGTSGLPKGMPAPRRIGVANAKQIGMSADHNRADAILLTYIADLRSYDTFTVRTESKTEESGTGDEFTRTITVETFTDFFRVSQPDVPVRTILDSKAIDIYHTVKGYDVFGDFSTSLELIESSTEIFRYDDVGLLLSRHKTSQKRLPDPDNSFTIGFIPALDELETITYKQHPYKPMRTYVANRSIVTNGLIFVDVDNTQLDQPFGQDANKVFQAGNVTTEQLATFGALRTYRETGKPLRSGRVRYHIIEIDQAAGCVTENYEEERDGDLGVKSTVQEPRQVYVLQDDDAVRTSDKIIELHAGEAPVSIGIPLARRVLLQENVFPNTVALQIIGIDDTLTKGAAITAIGREQEDLGDYIIEARTFGEKARGEDGKPGEAFMVLEVRQANE